MLDPIRDSWEARIRSMRMSSKNLIGENAETCKKVSKNQFPIAVNFRVLKNQDPICVLASGGRPLHGRLRFISIDPAPGCARLCPVVPGRARTCESSRPDSKPTPHAQVLWKAVAWQSTNSLKLLLLRKAPKDPLLSPKSRLGCDSLLLWNH